MTVAKKKPATALQLTVDKLNVLIKKEQALLAEKQARLAGLMTAQGIAQDMLDEERALSVRLGKGIAAAKMDARTLPHIVTTPER